jgi:hypothetical protein
MPTTEPFPARHTVEDLGDSLRFVIPSRRRWFHIAFFLFWLVGWGFGEFAVIVVLLSELTGTPLEELVGWSLISYSGGLLALVWLVFWTIGGVLALYVLLWQLSGKEVVEVSGQSIRIQRRVIGLGRFREYLARHVQDLRISVEGYYNTGWGWFRTLRAYGIGGGLIAFDYGAKTFRFGSGIDEAEAKQILSAIQQRFPEYNSKSAAG